MWKAFCLHTYILKNTCTCVHSGSACASIVGVLNVHVAILGSRGHHGLGGTQGEDAADHHACEGAFSRVLGFG